MFFLAVGVAILPLFYHELNLPYTFPLLGNVCFNDTCTSVGGCVLCCIEVLLIFIPGHCCWAGFDKHAGLQGCGVHRRVISFKQEVVAR